MKALSLFILSISLLGLCSCRGDPYSSFDLDTDTRTIARRASIQTVFHVPIMHVFFPTPLPKPEKLTHEKVIELLEAQEEALQQQINDSIEAFKREFEEDRWESSLTKFEEWGYDPDGRTFIPLGAFTPKHVKFPERVLVVRETKVEAEEITPWEKEYQEDVLAISETANVSPSKAKEILTNIKNKGYTISKEAVTETDDIKLLRFTPDWSDKYPTTLDWTVEVIGEENNLIIGYDPRGILEIKPVPADTKLHIKAGYQDIKSKFKDEPTEITTLKAQLETLRENLKVANEEIAELKEKNQDPIPKRDISKVTLWDIRVGKVKVEQFFFMTSASGIFLGNMQIRPEMSAWSPMRGWGYYGANIQPEQASVYLTNAHVASIGRGFAIMVDEERENMWIIFPGAPSIRHTKDSDYFGTPASILQIDQSPVISWDVDAGILVATPIPTYEKYKAVLGDSDVVKAGDTVITVGNPSGFQKFTSQGVVSNTDFSFIDTLNGAHYLKWIQNKPSYSWMLNSCFWIDTPIGCGGVSGSGVWNENGEVIALRNMGLNHRYDRVAGVENINIDALDWDKLPDSVSGITKEHFSTLFGTNRPTGKYDIDFEDFVKQHSELEQLCGMSVPVSGMSGGIPINRIKRFLEERGLSPEHFGWEKLKDSYWVK